MMMLRWGHCVKVIAPSDCSSLQHKAMVDVVYTTYLPIYNNNQPSQGYDWTHTEIVKPLAAQFIPNLTACATTPANFFPASDGPSLIAGIQTIFADTVSTARITE